MKWRQAILGAAAVTMLLAVGVQGQSKPSFAGTWTIDRDKTLQATPGLAGALPGQNTIEIIQDSNTIKILGLAGEAGPLVYNLDGSASTQPGGRRSGGRATPWSARAKWQDGTLTVELSYEDKDGLKSRKQVFAYEGEWLVITATANFVISAAGTLQPDPALATTKLYFKKTPGLAATYLT